MNVTFIIPCYNAEKIINNNHKKLSSFLKKNKIKKKIIYINDGSEDKTLYELKKINEKNVEILSNKDNSGKSYSIIKALKLVKNGNVVLIDCDLPYFNYLKKVINGLAKFDLIIVNRKTNKSSNLEKNFNLIVCVISSKKIRTKRVLKNKKFSKKTLNKIFKLQTSDKERRRRSHIIIVNNKTKKDFIFNIEKALIGLVK